jgi:hypothetical protein
MILIKKKQIRKISIFLFYYENMLGKLLRFDCIHENKIFFVFDFFKRGN